MSGVEYTSTEVEAATEQSPEVVSGSSVACATGSLVIFFVPTNGSLSSQGSLLKSLAGHLALTLGIHAHRIIAIPASNFSRRFDGLPCREFFQKLIQRKRLLDESNESSEWRDEDLAKEVLKEKGTLDSKEPSPLPSDWIFEEDFKHVAALEEDEDEDALEERMEGAMEAEAVEHQRILLVIVPHAPPSQLSQSVVSTLKSELSQTMTVREVTPTEALAVVAREVFEQLTVVHLLNCFDDVEAVSCLIHLLQAWERTDHPRVATPRHTSKTRPIAPSSKVRSPVRSVLSLLGLFASAAFSVCWVHRQFPCEEKPLGGGLSSRSRRCTSKSKQVESTSSFVRLSEATRPCGGRPLRSSQVLSFGSSSERSAGIPMASGLTAGCGPRPGAVRCCRHCLGAEGACTKRRGLARR